MTYFVNFTREQGDISLAKYHQLVTSGPQREIVEQVRRLVIAGDSDAAADIKKKLPSVTPSGLFRKGRKKDCFCGHTLIICLDFDHVGPRLAELKTLLCSDPHTLHCAVSPSGDGLKVLVAVCLTDDTPPPAAWDAATAFHKTAYDTVMRHYSTLLGIQPDTSGRDITRLCFITCDPEAYLNGQAEPFEIAVDAAPLTPAAAKDTAAEALPEGEGGGIDKEGGGGVAGAAAKKKPVPLTPEERKAERARLRKENDERYRRDFHSLIANSSIATRRRMAYLEILCKNLYREGETYREGNRHKFMYILACRLNECGIPQAEAVAMMKGLVPLIVHLEPGATAKKPEEVEAIVRDVYEKELAAHGKKRITKGIINQIYMEVEFRRMYDLRYNVLSMKLEVRDRGVFHRVSDSYREIDDRVVNEVAKAMREMGRDVTTAAIREDIATSFAPDFDPLKDYLDRVPEWDGQDHIAMFADSVESADPERFRNLLRMFYVGMVGAYFNPIRTNDIMLILYSGSQGQGKTFFIDRLLPPELHDTMHEGGPQGNYNDFLQYIATKTLIFVDEYQRVRPEDRGFIDDHITKKQIEFRRPYAYYSLAYEHKASFIGACNSTSFMNGPHGNRRDFIIEVFRFHPFTPNYPQIFAQIKHLLDTGFKYWFDPDEQEELAAFSYSYEHNSDEFEMVRKYVREYSGNCKEVHSYKVKEIFTWINKFDPNMIGDRNAIGRLSKALGRRNIPSRPTHSGKEYTCYLMNAEQAEYVEKHRDSQRVLDRDYDIFIPREVLIAGDDAKIADIVKAKELLDKCGGDFNAASRNYQKYITEEKDISFRNTDTLPF
jgi:hypothetical protein